jgi:beta-lactamase superfamily II metal-dependent hydrolase
MTNRLVVSRVFFWVVLLAFPISVSAQQLEIHYINVSWGGSVFVKGPNGTTVLLEAGNTGRGTGRVVPYLQSIGIMPATGLDYTFAGHQHCDHIGGLDEVINAGYNVHIKNYYNGSSTTSTCVTGWNTAAASTTAGAPVSVPVGTVIQLGNGAKLTVVARNGSIIGGGSVSVSDENDRSIAVLIQYGGFDYLWASDMGGGNIDEACTGRFTSSQTDVESSVVQAISPGGAFPLISAGGIDVLNVNHHGSESSTNKNWMNLSQPAVAVISTGSGQSTGWDLPRIDVVEHVLLAQATACITVPPALVLQTEEGAPTGSLTSFAGYSVGNIKLATDGVSTFTVSADGAVTQGANELVASGLPRTIALDDVSGPPDTDPPVISNVQASAITASGATITWTTDEASNSAVEYGLTTSYGSSASNTANVSNHSIALSGLSANTLYHYRVKSTDSAGNTATSVDHSFQTGGSTNYAPTATTILAGSLNSGSFSNLSTNNESYYQVNSTTTSPRVTDWYASAFISEAPASVSRLITTYNGDYTKSNTTNTLYLFNWSTATWTQIDSRIVGETDFTVTNTQLAPANFISPSGEVRLRVRGARSSNQSFVGRGDFVRFTVESAGSSISRSLNNGKNWPSIFWPDAIAGTPSSRGVSEAERVPSRKALITRPRRGVSVSFA